MPIIRLYLPSDCSNFCWNSCNLLICFFSGAFLPAPPNLRLICGLPPPLLGLVRSTEFSLTEKLVFSYDFDGSIGAGTMAAALMADSCWLLGLLSFLLSLSELSESASAERVKSFMLVTRLRSESFESDRRLAWALPLLIIDPVFEAALSWLPSSSLLRLLLTLFSSSLAASIYLSISCSRFACPSCDELVSFCDRSSQSLPVRP